MGYDKPLKTSSTLKQSSPSPLQETLEIKPQHYEHYVYICSEGTATQNKYARLAIHSFLNKEKQAYEIAMVCVHVSTRIWSYSHMFMSPTH